VQSNPGPGAVDGIAGTSVVSGSPPNPSAKHSLLSRMALALLAGGGSSQRLARRCMPMTVLSCMSAAPLFALTGWLGMLLPVATLLHQVAWMLLMGALLALLVGIIGAQMCAVVALPPPALVVELLVEPLLSPLLTILPITERTPVLGFLALPLLIGDSAGADATSKAEETHEDGDVPPAL
jgi:hypothetical protein